MNNFDVQFEGMDELKKAITRNPQKVISETQSFLQRGMAAYRQTIQNKPWGIGDTGGGTPVDTRNLVQIHRVVYDKFQASIGPSRNYNVPYAAYVHEGTRVMLPRPWLDYAMQSNQNKIESLYKDLLKNIVTNLSN